MCNSGESMGQPRSARRDRETGGRRNILQMKDNAELDVVLSARGRGRRLEEPLLTRLLVNRDRDVGMRGRWFTGRRVEFVVPELHDLPI